jgi:hypothetical protein
MNKPLHRLLCDEAMGMFILIDVCVDLEPAQFVGGDLCSLFGARALIS